MQRSQQQLLELVRCSLWGGIPNIDLFDGGVDWCDIIRLAKEQTVLGHITESIEKLPLAMRPPRGEALKLHQLSAINRQIRVSQVNALRELLKMLNEIGVDQPVLLKGLGVGCLYADPQVRMYGDIDLYVGEEAYPKVWEFACQRFGVTEEDENEQHFHFDLLNSYIEIHQFAVALNRFKKWVKVNLEVKEGLRRVEIEDVTTYLPPLEFDYIYIFFHMWRHLMTGGVGLRQLCDWTIFVDTYFDKIDMKLVNSYIDKFQIRKQMEVIATIAVHELGMEKHKFEGVVRILEAKSKLKEQVLQRIWSRGNFGFYYRRIDNKSKTVFARKFRTLIARTKESIFMARLDKWYALQLYVDFIFRSSSIAIKKMDHLSDKIEEKKRRKGAKSED